MMRNSAKKKFVAGAATAAAILSLGAGAASAGPFDFPPIPVPGPSTPIPLEPAPVEPDTDLRPVMTSSLCSFGQVWVDFKDPDGTDLRMDVEIGYYVGRADYEVHTMTYSRHHDRWTATVPAEAKGVVVQATDEDTTYSLGVHLRPSLRTDCAPRQRHFNNAQDVDIFGPDAIQYR